MDITRLESLPEGILTSLLEHYFEERDMEMISLLVRVGAELDSCGDEWIDAVRNDDRELVELIADSIHDSYIHDGLCYAIEMNREYLINFFLDKGAQISKSYSMIVALDAIVGKTNIELLDKLNDNIMSEQFVRKLSECACDHENIAFFESLRNKGTEIPIRTIVNRAVENQKFNILKYLLGIWPGNYSYALTFSIYHKLEDFVVLLLDNGTVPTKNHIDPALKSSGPIMKHLLAKGIAIETQYLYRACELDNFEVFKILYENMPEFEPSLMYTAEEIKDKFYRCLIHHCKQSEKLECYRYLISNVPDIVRVTLEELSIENYPKMYEAIESFGFTPTDMMKYHAIKESNLVYLVKVKSAKVTHDMIRDAKSHVERECLERLM